MGKSATLWGHSPGFRHPSLGIHKVAAVNRCLSRHPINTQFVCVIVSRLAPMLKKLADAQSRMLSTADEVPSDQWRTPPKNGGWCAAEIIAHLIMVERSVVGSADRVVQHPPRRFTRL